jgi:hypothetical protein
MDDVNHGVSWIVYSWRANSMSVGQIRRTQRPSARRISLSSKDLLYKLRCRYSNPVISSIGAGCVSWSWTPWHGVLFQTMHIASENPCILLQNYYKIALNVITKLLQNCLKCDFSCSFLSSPFHSVRYVHLRNGTHPHTKRGWNPGDVERNVSADCTCWNPT